LADLHGVNLEGALTWAFEFEDQPYFAGFRTLASNGLDKQCLTSFGNVQPNDCQRLSVESDHARASNRFSKRDSREPDIAAMASLGKTNSIYWSGNYHDDDIAGPAKAPSS